MRTGIHIRFSPSRRRSLLLILDCALILLLLILTYVHSHAAPLPARILVLESANGGPYAAFTRQFKQSLQTENKQHSIRIDTLTVAQNASAELPNFKSADLVIAVGTRATEIALQSNAQATILSVLVPRLTADRLARGKKARAHTVSAIYLDQPPSRYMKLARIVMPNSGKLGVILGPATVAEKDQLDRAAIQNHITLIYAAMEPGKTNPLSVLQGIIRDCHALLALPDPRVYNRYSLPPLLLTTFRYRVPVIGFSPAFVRAGAVAGVYSTPEQIAKQAADMVLHGDISSGGRYPNYFHVGFNFTVAQALDISLPKTADAEKLLKRAAGGP